MNAVIYARYSSDQQREESIHAQVRACTDYADKNGITIVAIYADEAKSGKTDQREQFLKMIKDSNLGMFQCVLVHKLDRFARNRYDSAVYKKKLKDNGVKIFSVLEQLTDTPEAILMESLLEGLNEYYSANLARETMKGMKENAYQCKFNGGRAPLGYDIVSGNYVINENEAAAVRRIFDIYANGGSYKDICDELNHKGIRTRYNHVFAKNSLHEILSNQRYVGNYIYNQAVKKSKRKLKPESEVIRVEGGIPQIIDKETFERVKSRMSSQKRNATNKAIENYLLSGLFFCGQCGSAMVGNRKTRGEHVYAYYECGGRKRKFDCMAKSIQKISIETQALKELECMILNPMAFDGLVKKINSHIENKLKELTTQLSTIERDYISVKAQISNIVDSIADGMYHPSMKGKMDVLEARKAELGKSLVECDIQKGRYGFTEDMLRRYLENDMYPTKKPENEQKRILQRYIKRIDLYADHAEVRYNVDITGCGTRI
jgi:site-specific DNA recombinase